MDYVVKDSSLTAVADAIRAKSGSSSQLIFPTGFVSEIGNISGGGSNGLEIVSGTFTLSSSSKSKSLSIDFQPDNFVVYALNSTFPTDNNWKTLIGFMSQFGSDWWVINRYGASNINGATRAASNHSYSDGTFTFSFNYNMATSITYYWYAWRNTT